MLAVLMASQTAEVLSGEHAESRSVWSVQQRPITAAGRSCTLRLQAIQGSSIAILIVATDIRSIDVH